MKNLKKKRKKRPGAAGVPRSPALTPAEALRRFARSPATRLLATSVVDRAWRRAYELAGEPHRVLTPEEGYCLALIYQDTLKDEMRRLCKEFPADELFFATRMWSPGVLAASGLSFGEDETPGVVPRHEVVATMALRRVAVAAALLYGAAPKGRVTTVGGQIPPERLVLFVAAFVGLLALSYAYLVAWTFRMLASMGYGFSVEKDGMKGHHEDEEKLDILTYSNDNRRHRYHNLLSRVGEFGEIPLEIFEPNEDRDKRGLGDHPVLYSAWYERDRQGILGYRIGAQPLGHVEDVLLGLDPASARGAWGMSFKEFIALLGGFSAMVGHRLNASRSSGAAGTDMRSTTAQGAFLSATLSFSEVELEGDGKGSLVAYAADYAKKKGFDLSELDLGNARQKFLDLAISNGKKETADDSPDPLGISIGDGRYAHLLHKFGKIYIVDLFHADHWINRPLDLLAGKMRGGEPGRLKGKRVEDAVWDYMRRSKKITPVEELRNAELRLLPGSKKQSTDIDCPLRVGDTLILAEVKGKYLGRAPEAFAEPALVEKRWEENRDLLEKVDAAARALVARRDDGTFREGMKGIRRVLPVVVRPLPEWIPDLGDELWLRKPTRTDVGMPRVLTPQELKDFLERTTEDEIAELPGGYVVEIKDL